MRSFSIPMCVIVSFIAFSQTDKREIDSLQNLINTTTTDTLKVKYLLKLEYSYRFTDFKKGLAYADKALHISEKINWKKGLALCYNNIGNSYLDRGEHATALENYTKSLQYSEPFLKNRLMTLMNVSNIYLREKNFRLSLKYINEAYKIAIKLKDQEEIAYCYYQFGLINRDQGKLKNAKSYFVKSLVIFKAKDNLFQVAELTNFIAEVSSDYKQKLHYSLESKSVWDKVAPNYLSAVNNSILISKSYIELIKNDSLKKITGITKSNPELIKETEELLNKAIIYSKKSDTKQNLMDAYGVLSEIKYMKKEFSEAYNYSVLHNSIKDSIFSQESKNKIAALESQKEIALRDKQILINKITLKDEERQKWFLISGLAFLAIIGGLLFYQNNSRKKTNKKLQLLNSDLDTANKSKIKLLGILNHDLRSPINSFIHYAMFKKESQDQLDQATKNRIENATLLSAKNLLNSMEDILFWTKSQMENFTPQIRNVAIATIFDDTKNHFLSEEKVKIMFENPENIHLNTDENYLKTIIRNLTGNAIKALEKVENPAIRWKARQDGNHIYLSISDNGTGATQDQFKALYDEKEVVGIKTGLGLHLIRDLAKAIDCKIIVDSEPNQGTTFTLEFRP